MALPPPGADDGRQIIRQAPEALVRPAEAPPSVPKADNWVQRARPCLCPRAAAITVRLGLVRFAISTTSRSARLDALGSAAFAAPVWLWSDPDRPECGQIAVDTVEDAKAALYSSVLACHRHADDGRVRPEWLDAFVALDHAKSARTCGEVEAARRLFRSFAELSGALVRAYVVREPSGKRPWMSAQKGSVRCLQEDRPTDGCSLSLTTTRSACSTRMVQGTAMNRSHRVRLNGEEFWASNEELLLDAALRNGIDIPHDCRSGQCGKCRVRTVKGELFAGGRKGAADEVHACESRVIADVTVAADALPERLSTAAHVARSAISRPISPRCSSSRRSRSRSCRGNI